MDLDHRHRRVGSPRLLRPGAPVEIVHHPVTPPDTPEWRAPLRGRSRRGDWAHSTGGRLRVCRPGAGKLLRRKLLRPLALHQRTTRNREKEGWFLAAPQGEVQAFYALEDECGTASATGWWVRRGGQGSPACRLGRLRRLDQCCRRACKRAVPRCAIGDREIANQFSVCNEFRELSRICAPCSLEKLRMDCSRTAVAGAGAVSITSRTARPLRSETEVSSMRLTRGTAVTRFRSPRREGALRCGPHTLPVLSSEEEWTQEVTSERACFRSVRTGKRGKTCHTRRHS